MADQEEKKEATPVATPAPTPAPAKVEPKKVELHHVDQDLQKHIDYLREVADFAKKKGVTFAEAKTFADNYVQQAKAIEDARQKRAVGDYYASLKKEG